MERKIMSLGRSSFVISLPKHWMKLNELKKGDVGNASAKVSTISQTFPFPALYVNIPSVVWFPFFSISC